MKLICVFFVLCLSKVESENFNKRKFEFLSLTKNNGTEQKKWNLRVNINFTKALPPLVRRKVGTDAKLKCEAFINFHVVEKLTKHNERIETPVEDFPPEYKQNIIKNIKVNWLKDNNTLQNQGILKIDVVNNTVSSVLRLKNVQTQDEGNYTCVVKQTHERKQMTRLIVDENGLPDEIPTYGSLFPDSLYTESNKATTFNVVPLTTVSPQHLEPICQEYVGEVCSIILKGQYVYIPYTTTQSLLETKLKMAMQVINFSKEISFNCEKYARPSMCYSIFPICRDPMRTNDNFFKTAKQLLSQMSQNKSNNNDDEELVIEFENLPNGGLPKHLTPNKNTSIDILDYRYNSTILRRVCKQDCEILENELCETEYAIAKHHPHIGKQLILEECQDLLDHDPDCLKIPIGLMVSDDKCYWENGNSYLGTASVADNGMPCIKWSKQLHVTPRDYPELAGRHSYCRNPGGLKSQPWCFIDKNGKAEEQLCNIPKCAHRIWIYIVTVFILLTLIIISFIICLYCKNKRKKSAAAIMDMNLPNADKNIYGNSRLNSPIEMSDLLANQNLNNPLNPNRNVRGNGILRIPQYSLSQIRFLEELGEGAFGKVYKGALSKGGETQYVAVKALKENASAKTQGDFRREIDLISELRHDNIVCIVGVALREEPLCMLFEFMARGDLHEFLMGRAPPSGKGLPSMRLLNIAYNIASGMQYLASHHYVHRDLAARNCLVSDDFVVKISDFGLSRDIYSSDYYRVSNGFIRF